MIRFCTWSLINNLAQNTWRLDHFSACKIITFSSNSAQSQTKTHTVTHDERSGRHRHRHRQKKPIIQCSVMFETMKLPSNAIIINSFWNEIMFRHSNISSSFPWTTIDKKKTRHVKWLKTDFSNIIFVLSIREPTALGFEFTEFFFLTQQKRCVNE